MKVLIVDDSALIRNILKSLLIEAGDFTILGEASNGVAAIEMVKKDAPDLVIMDINMPLLNGLQATERIMAERPVPICIFSNEVDSDLTIKALGLGAVDALRKPDIDKFSDKEFLQSFLSRLRTLSTARLVKPKRVGSFGEAVKKADYSALVIGASTGGPIAVKEVLSRLPKTFPLGIALVQHIEDRFDQSYAHWLNSQVDLSVRLSRERDEFVPGTVLVAPAGKHLICREGYLSLEDGPKVVNQKPAVDRLFETAGNYFRDRVIGVLLTGMGTDGAFGCVTIKNRGGYTIVQDEETSTIFGMPKAAIDRGGACKVLPLLQIPDYLIRLAGG